MHVSSVLTALGPLYIAESVFHMHIGTLHFIAHCSGPQHTTRRYHCSHWGLCFALGMLVFHVQAQLKYVHMMYVLMGYADHYAGTKGSSSG